MTKCASLAPCTPLPLKSIPHCKNVVWGRGHWHLYYADLGYTDTYLHTQCEFCSAISVGDRQHGRQILRGVPYPRRHRRRKKLYGAIILSHTPSECSLKHRTSISFEHIELSPPNFGRGPCPLDHPGGKNFYTTP